MMKELWKSDANWFATWFNTPAYHALYGNRNEEEANRFIHRLAQATLSSGDRVLDLGCGAGRHSASLNRLGYDTVGLDLSLHSIQLAREKYRDQTDGLAFQVGDMREMAPIFPRHSFHAVFSLFTSIGYFEEPDGLSRTLAGVNHVLEVGGVFVLDFLNPEYVRSRLVSEEVKRAEGYTFHIHRRMIPGWIEKSIQYIDRQDQPQHHVERVRAMAPSEWKTIFNQHHWEVWAHYGDYELNPWQGDAPRSILAARKMACG